MFGQTANGPQRIFSPMGEFLAWDTLFLQKASAPSLKHLIERPDYPLLTKPKRPPESFVILLEEGPPGMSTPSAGSKAALYEQAREEYNTQRKLHSQLQKWVKNSLNKDLFDACCRPGQNAFQWRRNIVELLKGELKEPIIVLLKGELKEPSDPKATEQAASDNLKRQHETVSEDDTDDEPPKKKKRRAKREARREREASVERRLAALQQEVIRLSAFGQDIARLETLVTGFQDKVTSFESGYGSGSAMTKKFASPQPETNANAESTSGSKSGSESESGSGSGSEESEAETDNDDYTSSPPVLGAAHALGPVPSSLVQEAQSGSEAESGSEEECDAEEESGAEEQDNYTSSPPVIGLHRSPGLAHAVGTELEDDYTSSSPVPPTHHAGFAVPSCLDRDPASVSDDEEDDQSESGSEEGQSGTDVESGSDIDAALDIESGLDVRSRRCLVLHQPGCRCGARSSRDS